MKFDAKKSLYVGIAALSLVAATGAATTNASAKSYATATSNAQLSSDPTTRNVTTTGTSALYTKAGTLRGARVIAGKATLSAYGSSNSSQQYFRAYRVATTNRGSVYYKVVSFNGNLRGWIYGGKSTTSFGGGIASANTMTNASLPTTTTGYTLTNPAKNGLWVNPKWSQYKAQQADMSGYKSGDTFTVIGAATKTREGWLYYQVRDDNNASVTGWVFAGGLTAKTTPTPTPNPTTPTKDNSVQINYVNASGQQVGSAYNWIIQQSDLMSGAKLVNGAKLNEILANSSELQTVINKNVPTGYTVSGTQDPSHPLANTTVGSSIAVYVTATPTVQQYASKLSYYDAKTGNQIPTNYLKDNTYPQLTTAQQAIFSSPTQTTINASLFDNAIFQAGNPLYSLAGSPQHATGAYFTPAYTFDAARTKTENANAKYGDTIKLFYDEFNM